MREANQKRHPSKVRASFRSEPGARVVLTDPTPMGCQLLRQVLAHSRYRFQVVATATSRSQISDILAHEPVDVLVLSEHLAAGPYSGFELLREIHATYPQTRVVMLLRSPTAELVVDAFRLGARGVFSRAGSLELLCKSIYSVHGGQIWANSNELQYLLEALTRSAPFRLSGPQGNIVLTQREDEVAKLVADGMTNRQIAKQLHLSEHTVSNYLFRIYEKLGFSSRVELVLYILRASQGAA